MPPLRSFGLALLAGCLGLLGCSGKPKDDGPPTYAVKGKVVNANGSPLKGSLEFRTADGSSRAFGTVTDDGTFELQSSTQHGTKPGALPGVYQATFSPHMGASQEQGGIPQHITLPTTFKVEEKDNFFTLTVPKK